MTTPSAGPAARAAADLRHARRALVVVGLVAPAVITTMALVLISLWLPEIPDPAATHWGLDGVDGFGPPSTYLWLATFVGFGIPVLMVASTLAMSRGQWGVTARFLGAMALGMAGLGAVINGGSVAVQRGLDDAAQVGAVWPVILGGFCVGALLALAGWKLQPDVGPLPSNDLTTVPLPSIGAGERVVWIGTATMARGAQITIAAAGALVLAVAVVTLLQAPEMSWVPLLVLVVVCLALAATASFRVRIGADGLTVRSQLGIPRLHVALDEITSVRAFECHPLAEFGGYGWRLGIDGRTGIVLRSGPAIEVARRCSGAVVITIDGADVAAATLQAHLQNDDRS